MSDMIGWNRMVSSQLRIARSSLPTSVASACCASWATNASRGIPQHEDKARRTNSVRRSGSDIAG